MRDHLRGIPLRHALAAVCLLGVVSCGPGAPAPRHPLATEAHLIAPDTALLANVDPLVGTSGDGNVFPGATVPFGMVQWSPDTSAGGLSRPGGYAYGDRIISGFSLTHLSGAGCVAFGNLPIMPTVRSVSTPPQPNGSPYSDRFVHNDEHAAPGRYAVRLASGIEIALTATPRTGFGTFSFPRGSTASLVINAGGGAGHTLNTDGAIASSIHVVGRNELTGSVKAGHFCGLGNTFTLYFDMQFSRPFSGWSLWQESALHHGARSAVGVHTGAAVSFSTRPSRTVAMKVGLSYVSVHNARLNLTSEDTGWNGSRVAAQAATSWSTALGHIRATGASRERERVFYTALYHAFLHPNIFSDVNGQYLGFDGRVHSAGSRVHYANFSGWDIYRSEVQLLAWLVPRQTSDMMQSMLDDATQEGALPKWPVANAETGEMNGDSADPILAGAYAFGARSFNAQLALTDMVRGATTAAPVRGGYIERPGLSSYLRLGYIPGYNPAEIAPYGAAATTLEYNIDDFSIAQMAHALGNSRVYSTYLSRSHSWRKLFDPATTLIEPRMDDGSFPLSINPTSLDGYVEGNALQYTWMVPHDLQTIVHLIGGTKKVIARLDPLFLRLNVGPTDPYDWAGNEPDFTLPWVYDFAGAPWRSQAVVRHVMTNRYTSTAGGLPGNDDLGALSSWYVWAALGLYPEVPGVAGWAIAAPIFPHVAIQSESGSSLQIVARHAQNPYIQSALVDGHAYRSAWLPLASLHRTSTLTFTLGPRPNVHWGT